MPSENKPYFFTAADTPEKGALYAGLFHKTVSVSSWVVALFRLPQEALVSCNRAAHRWLVGTQGEVPTGYRLSELLAVDDADRFKHQVLPQLRVFGGWTGRLRLRDARGSELDMEVILSCEGSGVAEHVCLVAVPACLDKRENRAATASDSELLQAVLSTVPESVYFKDKSGRFLRASRYMAQRFGLGDASALLGRTDFDLHSVDHARRQYEEEQEILKTQSPVRDREKQELLPGGEVAWITESKYPLYDREGDLAGTFGISRDITDRRREDQQRREMEIQMHLSQKLESIGRLASGVAHEINTPAQFITDNTQFLKRALQPLFATLEAYRQLGSVVQNGGDPAAALERTRTVERESRLDYFLREIPQTLDDTLEGLSRVTRIVRSLKEFSHPNQSTKIRVDLNRAVETTLALSRHEWKYVAEAKLDLQPDLPQVSCVVDEINQVILNLIVNAAHAIEDARRLEPKKGLGLITVRTRTDGDCVTIEVTDTGTGIADDVKAHLFEPFFTTKEVGRGTGQGLAIIRTVVVRNHGGSIFFDTELGKGTTFTVRLPIGEPSETTAKAATTPAPEPAGAASHASGESEVRA